MLSVLSNKREFDAEDPGNEKTRSCNFSVTQGKAIASYWLTDGRNAAVAEWQGYLGGGEFHHVLIDAMLFNDTCS